MECNGAGQGFLGRNEGMIWNQDVARYLVTMPLIFSREYHLFGLSILGMDLFGRDGCFIAFIDMDILSYVILKLQRSKEMLCVF